MDTMPLRLEHKMRHNRSKSFSDSLVLEDVDKGGVIVKSIRADSLTEIGLKAGDEIVGATIHFDKLNKDEVLRVLKLIEPYDENMKVLTKQDLKSSVSAGILNSSIASPEEMLKDSYSRIVHSKVQRFLNAEKTSDVPDCIIDADLKTPDLNLPVSTVKGGIKTPDIGLASPSAEIKGTELNAGVPHVDLKYPSLDLKLPTFPKLGIAGPKVNGPEVGIDGDLETPDLNLPAPVIKEKINTPEFGVDLPKAVFKNPKLDMGIPDLDMHSPSGKFTMPSLGLSGSKVKRPDFDFDAGLARPDLNLTAPKNEGGLKIPVLDGDLPGGDMKGPNVDVDLRSPSQQLKFPTLPKFGVSGLKVKGPEVDIDGDLETPDLNLSAPMIRGDINTPELGVDLPKADFNIPKLDMKTPDFDIDAPSGKLNMPKFNLTGPKVKGPDFDIDAGLKTKDLNLKAPKIKGGIAAPDIDLNLPSTDLKGNKLNMALPDVDLKSPSRKLKFPTLPKFGVSGPKVKGPDVDIDGDLETPDLNLSAPMIRGDINTPELGVDLPKADFNIPKLDMKTPDFDIDAPSGKLNMPKFNLTGPKVKGPDFDIDAGLKTKELNLKAPKIKGGIAAPDIDLNLPSTDLKGNKLNMALPDVDLKSPSRKLKFPTLPKFGVSGPKVKGPDVDIDGDLETPDLNLSAPMIRGDIHTPELGVDLPKADFNIPKLDMKTPDFDIDAPSGKFTMPKFNLTGPKVKGPDFDIDAGLKTKDLNLKAPKIKGGITAPDIDLNLPSTDLKGNKLNMALPDVDLKSPSRKLKFPTLPKFGVSGPKVKGPEVDIDGDLETPDLNLSAPMIRGDINTPELGVDLPKADFNIPKLDMKTPDFDIDAPSGKLNMPKFNLTGPKVKGPDFGIDAGLKTKDLNLKVPKIKGGITTPDVGMNLPSTDWKGNKFNVDVPDIDLKSPSRKWKFPTLPKFGISGPKVKHPEMGIKGDMETSCLSLPAPKIKGETPEWGVNLPKPDVNIPKLNMKTPDLDIDAPSGKLNMPKFNLTGPKVKRPDLDIDAGLKTKDLDLKAPKIKGRMKAPQLDVNLPKGDVKGPRFDLGIPDFDLKSPSHHLKFPTLPKFGISRPKAKVPELNIGGGLKTPDLNLPKADFNIPKLDLETPNLDIDAPSGKLNMPKFNLTGPKVKGPDFGIDAGLTTKDLNLKAPKIKGGIKPPDIDLNLPSTGIKGNKLHAALPDVELKSPSLKFKSPTLPKFGISGPKVKHPEMNIDGDFEPPDLSLSAPKAKGKLDAEFGVDPPKYVFKSPKLDMKAPDLDIDAPSGKLNMPKFNLTGPKVKKPDLDIDASLKTRDLNLKAPKIKGGITTPDIDLNLPSTDMKGNKLHAALPDVELKSPSLKFKSPTLPQFGISEPILKHPEINIDGDVDAPDLSLSAPMIKGKMNSPESDVNLPKADFNTPKLDMKTPHLDLDAPSGKLNTPTLKRPKYRHSDLNLDRQQLDIDAVFDEANLSGPKMRSTINTHDGGLRLPKTHVKAGLNGYDTSVASPKANRKSQVGMRNFDQKNPSVADLPKGIGYNLSDFEVTNFTAPPVSTNILSTPDIDLEVPGGTLKRPKLTFQTLI